MLQSFDISYPQFYVNSLHISSVIAFTVNIFTLYIVYNKSPTAMKNFKMILLYLQGSSLIVDVYLSFFMTIVPLLPLSSAYCVGFLWTIFGLSFHPALVIMCVLVGAKTAAMAHGFIYKHQTIVPSGHPYKLSKKNFYILCGSINIAYCVPIAVAAHNCQIPRDEHLAIIQEVGVQFTLKAGKTCEMYYPNAVEIFTSLPSLDTYNVSGIQFKILFLSWVTVITASLPIVGMVVHIFKILQQNKSIMSKRTYRLHRLLTVSLLLQGGTALFVYALPILFIVIFTYLGYENRSFYEVVLFYVTVEPTLSGATLLLTNAHYRTGCKECFISIYYGFRCANTLNAKKRRASSIGKSVTVFAI